MDHAPPQVSVHRIDDEPSSIMDYVVGDHEGSIMEVPMPVEIMEDEEAGKMESPTPERIRNPGVQIIIGLRRRVIGDHRRARINIIVVDHLGARVGDVKTIRGLAIFVGRRTGGLRPSISSNHFQPVPVFHGDGFILVGEMGDSFMIGILVNNGMGDIAPGNSPRGGRFRNAARSDTQRKPVLQVRHRLQSFALAHPQSAGLGCGGHVFFDFADHGRGYGVTRDPAVFRFNSR